MPSGAVMGLPTTVIRGSDSGPILWLSAAIHGDELNGTEIITRVLEHIQNITIRGTLIAVPTVNVFGFATRDRYFPDRRDLNRSFPGSSDGSLAAQVANLLMTEVVCKSTHGIDLHTGSLYRTNYPHVRTNLADPALKELALAFGSEIIMGSTSPRGSLRTAAARRGVPCIVLEGGEANRFDPLTIRVGTEGVLRVMRHLKMIEIDLPDAPPPTVCRETRWIRARRSGIFRPQVELGQMVKTHSPIGTITDSFGEIGTKVSASRRGIVLGLNLNPIVYRGDALAHIAFPQETGSKANSPTTPP